MKASQLIEKLIALAAAHGDLDVIVFGGYSPVASGEIEAPDPEYNADGDVPVILFDITGS